MLHLAVADHKFGAVKLLLEYGGDPSKPGNRRIFESTLVLGLNDRLWDKHKNEFPGWDLREALLDADKRIAQGCDSRAVVEQFVSNRFDLVEEFLNRGYNCELADLAWISHWHNSGEPENPARLRVIEILKRRCVTFPLHNAFERSANVKMLDDESLLVHWGDLHSRCGTIEPEQIIKKRDPNYDEILSRVGGLTPGETKRIQRRPEDARD